MSTVVTTKHKLLEEVGRRVRKLREQRGLTQRELASRANLSVRFLAQLEHGEGNISLARFADVAAALSTDPGALLAASPSAGDPTLRAGGPVIALLGLRGAGKSTVGTRLARKLGVT